MSQSPDANARVRVLVVDDDAEVRRLVVEALSEQGYEVCAASGGREAMEIARRERLGLILLDINMPRVDGWQVLEGLRASAGRQIAIVVMTSGFDSQNQALSGGAQGYLAKPFDLDDLFAAVEAHAGLPLRGGQEEARLAPHEGT